MANIALEKKVLGALVEQPELATRYHIEARWFFEERHRQVIYVLTTSEKRFVDISEIVLETQNYYPKTEVSEEWLQPLKFEAMYLKSLKASLKSLEGEYVSTKTNEASLTYGEYPNQKNKENLENWLRTLSELDIEEDTGELAEPTNELMDELENGTKGGLKTYKNIDRILGNGLEGGMLFVVGARPSTGKSALAINMAIETLIHQPDAQIDFFTLEMTKTIMLKRFVSRLTGINSYKFKNAKVALSDDEKQRVIKSAGWLNDTGLRIHDNRFKISEIERMIRQRKYENDGKPYLAFVDYIGLVNAEDARLQRNQQIGKISRTLKLITNELDVPIVLLSQLSRGIESRQDKTPTLADLRESGDLEQDANVVGFLHRDDEEEGRVHLSVAKNREGRTGTIPFDFFAPAMMFEEVDYYDS